LPLSPLPCCPSIMSIFLVFSSLRTPLLFQALWFHDLFCVGAGRVPHRASQAADGAGRDGGRLRQSCAAMWRLVSSSCGQA
jgi:hypothetical protein